MHLAWNNKLSIWEHVSSIFGHCTSVSFSFARLNDIGRFPFPFFPLFLLLEKDWKETKIRKGFKSECVKSRTFIHRNGAENSERTRIYCKIVHLKNFQTTNMMHRNQYIVHIRLYPFVNSTQIWNTYNVQIIKVAAEWTHTHAHAHTTTSIFHSGETSFYWRYFFILFFLSVY